MRNLDAGLKDGSLEFPLLTVAKGNAAGELEVRSPYDETLLARVASSGQDHVDSALDVAHRLFRDRAGWLPVPQRIEILTRTAALMSRHADDLALMAALEGGKPLRDSIVEVTRAINGVELCIEALRGNSGHVIPLGTTTASAGRTAFTRKEPIGVVVAISAFNHPLNLIVHQIGPAIAAGCPVIVKPAQDTPLSALNFVELLYEAGLPREWCQALVTNDVAAAEALATDPRVAFFSFIGSARVGWMLRAKLAPGTRCALEHGGVAPVILGSTYDETLALDAILKGGFYHAGQVCVSVQRVFSPRRRAKAFAEQLATAAKQLQVGDPTDEATEVGPLIRHAEVKRVGEWVDEACADGGTLLCGGKALSKSCYAPTVILDPPVDAKVSQLEIFGPVVCVYSYDTLDEAITAANALPTAFQSAVFSSDLDEAMAVYSALDAAAVMVNDHTAFRDDVMPFAGLRESGLGVGGIPYTFEDMQIDKMCVLRAG